MMFLKLKIKVVAFFLGDPVYILPANVGHILSSNAVIIAQLVE